MRILDRPYQQQARGGLSGVGVRSVFLAAALLVLAGCGDPHVAKGKKTFARFCAPCHGTGGAGDGYNAVNLDPHARDLTDTSEAYMVKLSNQEIYDVISQGGRGVDLAPLMPAWGKVFSEDEIWSLVAYIRTLHPYKGEPVQFDEAKPYSRQKPKAEVETEAEFEALMAEHVADEAAREARIAQGEEGFGDFGCIGCHKVGEQGGALGPDLTRGGFMLQPQFIYRWVRNPQSFKPKTRMPNLGLEKEEALSIALYVSTLKGSETAPAQAPPVVEPAAPAEGKEGAAPEPASPDEPSTEAADAPMGDGVEK